MADVNYMMKGIQRAFERQKKQALVAEKQPPVAAKAPVVAPKQEPKKEEPLKSNLTEEEIQYYCNLIHQANARSPSHPNNPTNRIIRERLAQMGLQPTSAE
ncbi:hypothetical protein GFK97_07595 [Pseudomonas stutzeri]|jgi:hypothetical protein|uniref:hypothetical protein n=1 Tax=Stutzerimonas stutzeri TaxID=316 RepID=UPI001909636C|nr:hypothetical protein [Stutzerimonas stutzeri]MBK3880606.1 hypothetical protein [Stutzerimonas stutzeri]MCQ4292010.1 hypothetical protein [Stutzerimonas stutzeri]